MQVQRIDNQRPAAKGLVTVKLCGNVIEVRHCAHGPPEMVIQKLNEDEYLNLRTGAVEQFHHTANRAENITSVSQSLRNLRDIINANLTDPEMALWVTLTYKENMKDTQRLYEDFHAFIKRFRRYLKREGHPPAEYIAAAEPQGRGAWHLHCLFLFSGKAPFIPNSDMARIWGHGFTKTKSLKGVDNPGLYLTAYLGDMELTEAVNAGHFKAGRLGESKDKSKAVIKGARLHLYPSGFNLYRCSRGVKRPEVWQTTEQAAQKIIGTAPLTYEKTIALTDSEGQTINVINYRQYNRARAEKQAGKATAGQVDEAEAGTGDSGAKSKNGAAKPTLPLTPKNPMSVPQNTPF